MIPFLLSLLLVLVFAAFLAALAPRSKPASLVAFYLAAFAHLVLVGYALNLFHALNREGLYLALQAALVFAAWRLWKRLGAPPLFGAFSGFSLRIRQAPILSTLAAGLALAYAYGAFQNLRLPQNNMDSLSTHLARIGYWLQFGSFSPWQTPKLLQLVYPVNAQLLTYWTILFLRRDILVGFVQWSAALASGLAVFGLGRALGYRRRASAFAALLYLGFPLILLQSTTTQNDVVAASLFAAAVYFFVRGIRQSETSSMLFSALALGLGLGTKQTFYFLLPGLGILFLLAAAQYGAARRALLRNWLLASLAAFLTFGVYMNLINWRYFGAPFGPPDLVAESTGSLDPASMAGALEYNIPRFLYQSLDTCGLPRPYKGYAHKLKAKSARFLLDAIHFDIEGEAFTQSGHVFLLSEPNPNEESSAWYGPLSALLLFPAMLYEGIRSLRRKNYLKTALALNAFFFLVVDVLARPGWDPYQGRYFAPAIAASAPLMGVWFEKRRPLFEGAVAALALLAAFVTMLYNPAKPLLGKYADELDIYHRDRLFLATIQNKDAYPMHEMVETFVPADATLGLVSPSYCFEYLLFGERFTRRVVPVYPEANLHNPAWLRGQEIEYLLVQGDSILESPPEGFVLLHQVPGWTLYQRTSPP